MIVSASKKEALFIPEDVTITQSDAVIGIPNEIFISEQVAINLGSSVLVVHA